MRRIRPLTQALRRVYLASTYEVLGAPFRLERVSITDWPVAWRALGDRFIVLGACNPGGALRPEGINCRAMAALRRSVPGVVWHRARGGLHCWWEDMLAVSLPVARGRVLARRFGQNAIVSVRRGRPARLIAV